MKKKIFTLLTLLATVCSGAWATDYTQVASYNFEDGTTTPIVSGGGGRYSIVNADDATEGSKVVQINNTNSMYGSNCAYAVYDFSTLTSDATMVKVEFDMWASGVQSCFTLRDKSQAPAQSKNGYSSTGALIAIGSMRIGSANYFGVNGVATTGASLDTWYHVVIEINLTTSKVDYTIKNFAQTETIATVSNVAFYSNAATACTQLDFYSRGDSGNPTYMGAIDNIVVSKYVDASSHDYTINAVCGGVTIAQLASGICAEGSTYSTIVNKVIEYNDEYYVLDDATVTGYTTESYTMGNTDETKEITYTKDETIIYYIEGEALSQSTSSDACSGGAYSYYYAGPRSFSVTEAGTYQLETNVVARASSSSLEVYTNNSTISVAQIAKNGGTGDRNCTFVAAASSTMRVGGPYYSSKFQNSLGFDYILIRKTGNDATVSKTMTDAGWATYCSPYALDFTGAIANLTKAYTITGSSGSTLILSEISGTVPENTGILLEGTAGTITIPVAASSSTDVTTNKLKGVTAATVKDAESIYVLMKEAAGVGFYKNTNEFTVGANTAYLNASDFDAAREFYVFEGETTGINAVKSAENNVQGEVYNLAGQRVAQPTKGLYIVNGKKVVIK